MLSAGIAVQDDGLFMIKIKVKTMYHKSYKYKAILNFSYFSSKVFLNFNLRFVKSSKLFASLPAEYIQRTEGERLSNTVLETSLSGVGRKRIICQSPITKSNFKKGKK